MNARVPGLLEGLRWAMEPDARGGGASRHRLVWRTARATLLHAPALRRWMGMAAELQSREIVRDLPGAYLRAVRPYVHRGTGVGERVVQLMDHMDWVEGAFQPPAFTQLADGRPVVLLTLTPPPGYESMRLQVRQAPPQSPEGDLLLTLTLRRSQELQHKPQPVDAAVLAFSRFRIDGSACLVIGGVRGQRDPVHRVSAAELALALHGWKPPVLLVRVAQELARWWGLNLVGLDPAAHRLHGWSYRLSARRRQAGERIFASYRALWDHFGARNGPSGWVVLPLDADEKLEATALSPEKRMRQTRRADYWIRTRNALRSQIRKVLQHPAFDERGARVTQALSDGSGFAHPPVRDDGEALPSRVLETGPASLY